jgi:hypothetical protein
VLAPPAPQERDTRETQPDRARPGRRSIDERQRLGQPAGLRETATSGDRIVARGRLALAARFTGARLALAQQRGDGGAKDAHARGEAGRF